MQQFALIFRFRKMPLEKEKSLKAQIESIASLSPTQTLGGYVRRIPKTNKQLILNHPNLQEPIKFSVCNNSKNLIYYLSIYNLACSLQSCYIKHRFMKSDDNSSYLEVIITPSGSRKDFTTDVLNQVTYVQKGNTN